MTIHLVSTQMSNTPERLLVTKNGNGPRALARAFHQKKEK